MSERVPAFVLGGTGYVAGELIRLILQHGELALAGVSSQSQAGQPIAAAFPHLAPALGDHCFVQHQGLLDGLEATRAAAFCAAPHGASAALIRALLAEAEERDLALTLVDVSADFRFAQAADYEAVYRHPHGAPELLSHFSCALPEHLGDAPTPHVAHPGCFATAMLLGAVPLLKLDLAGPAIFAAGVTGSTGAGRSPIATTHHPERHANLFAYNPLGHRHAPEVVGLCERFGGRAPELHFVPHSGPFARGIHMTLQAPLRRQLSTDEVREALAGFYADAEFVLVRDGLPRVKDVAGSNYAHLGAAVNDRSIAVMVVIDNLIKGAAGGAMQWMNRKFGWPESSGLAAPAIGWL